MFQISLESHHTSCHWHRHSLALFTRAGNTETQRISSRVPQTRIGLRPAYMHRPECYAFCDKFYQQSRSQRKKYDDDDDDGDMDRARPLLITDKAVDNNRVSFAFRHCADSNMTSDTYKTKSVLFSYENRSSEPSGKA